MLIKAGLVIPVTHSAANGIPIGAETNPKKRKMLPLDTGLFQRMLGLDMSEIFLSDDFEVVNKGAIAEIYAGLELQNQHPAITRMTCTSEKRRAEQQCRGRLPYSKNEDIIPVEIKSGKRGSMQSLHLFLKEKQSPYGIRSSSENFCAYENIKVIPLYAIGNVYQLT